MLKLKPEDAGKIRLDLTGESGNVFHLLGCARELAKQRNLNFKQIELEMTANDYENAILVFESYFGESIILECDAQLFERLQQRRQI